MKMFWKWFWKGLSVLLALSIFVVGGFAIYKAGYINGTAEGMVTSIPVEQVIKPNLAFHHVTLLLLPLIGLFLLFVFPLILFAGFRHYACHWMGNPAHLSNLEELRKRWGKRHYRHPYPGHWWDDSDKNQEKSTTPEESKNEQEDSEKRE